MAENSINYFYPSCGSKARATLAPPAPLARGVGTSVGGGPQIDIPSGIMPGDVTEDDTQPVAVG